MPTKIIYFLADRVATPEEEEDIAKLNSMVFEISVMHGQGSGDTGYGDNILQCDYVAGTVPDAYSDIPIYDASQLPGAGAGAGEPSGPSVSNGQIVHVRNYQEQDSHQGIAVVSGTTFEGVNLGRTTAIVDDGDEFPVSATGSIVIKVKDGVITEVKYKSYVETLPEVPEESRQDEESVGGRKSESKKKK